MSEHPLIASYKQLMARAPEANVEIFARAKPATAVDLRFAGARDVVVLKRDQYMRRHPWLVVAKGYNTTDLFNLTTGELWRDAPDDTPVAEFSTLELEHI